MTLTNPKTPKTIFELAKAVIKLYTNSITDTLLTKILLGTVGCTPTYDIFFKTGCRKLKIRPYSHFNVRSMTTLINFYKTNCGVFSHSGRGINIGQIYGFAPNNIWVVGNYLQTNPNPPPNFLDSSAIIHVNGTNWRDIPIQRGRTLQGIWGPSPMNVFAAGIFGTLYHYDGSRWTKIATDQNIWFSKIGGTADEIYLLGDIPNGYTPDHITREYLLQWKDTSFVLVDSMLLVPGVVLRFGSSFVTSIEGMIYSIGWGGIFIKRESGWENIISIGQSFYGLYRTRKEHVFACGTNKTLYHFNGTDWKKLDIPGDPTWTLSSVWCNDEKVFVLGRDGYRSYVIQGK